MTAKRKSKTISDKQIALLAKIIRAQGWRNPIVVSNRFGFQIIKGAVDWPARPKRPASLFNYVFIRSIF